MLMHRERLRGDPRLIYFGAAASASSGRHSAADRSIDQYYGGRCIVCGHNSGVTKAHLVSGSRSTTFPEFGCPHYRDNLDIKSVRNFIPLCGTKGERTTCHDAFDTFRLTILFNPLANNYYCFCLDKSLPKYRDVHLKTLTFHAEHRPYGRLLSWHARKCANEHPYWIKGEDVDVLLCAVDMSETKSVGHDDTVSSSSASV